ncbi:hypothetical protein GOV08_03695 [Candidatus Woesearchaeota archaeon]|nr:hypothetical protein [Candidatus Woesearchaeota archaeon]
MGDSLPNYLQSVDNRAELILNQTSIEDYIQINFKKLCSLRGTGIKELRGRKVFENKVIIYSYLKFIHGAKTYEEAHEILKQGVVPEVIVKKRIDDNRVSLEELDSISIGYSTKYVH